MKGSTAIDVLGTTAHLAVSVVVNAILFHFIAPKRYITLAYSSRLWIRSFVEYCVIVLPFIVHITVPGLQLALHSVILVFCLIQCYIFVRKPESSCQITLKLEQPYIQGPQTVLTNFRGAVNLATCICILAVDFKIFPEKFSKTFENGYGLMDVGVGCFVFANGLTGVETRTIGNFRIVMQKAVRTSLPLLFLGLVRYVSVAAIGYHYSIEEYGVHWNFFFTLGFVKILGPMISAAIPMIPPWAKALFISCLYEVCLMSNLRSWIFSDYPRETFLAANREGIFSLYGYLAIYWLAVEIGRYLNAERRNIQEWCNAIMTLSAWAVGFWIMTEIVAVVEGPPSRRLADLGYVLWMASYNLILICILFVVDVLVLLKDENLPASESKGSSLDLSQDFTSVSSLPLIREPYIYKSINYNGLSFFLASNVLTGLVNMLLDTRHASNFFSFLILNGYVLSICLFALVLYLWRLKLKF